MGSVESVPISEESVEILLELYAVLYNERFMSDEMEQQVRGGGVGKKTSSCVKKFVEKFSKSFYLSKNMVYQIKNVKARVKEVRALHSEQSTVQETRQLLFQQMEMLIDMWTVIVDYYETNDQNSAFELWKKSQEPSTAASPEEFQTFVNNLKENLEKNLNTILQRHSARCDQTVLAEKLECIKNEIPKAYKNQMGLINLQYDIQTLFESFKLLDSFVREQAEEHMAGPLVDTVDDVVKNQAIKLKKEKQAFTDIAEVVSNPSPDQESNRQRFFNILSRLITDTAVTSAISLAMAAMIPAGHAEVLTYASTAIWSASMGQQVYNILKQKMSVKQFVINTTVALGVSAASNALVSSVAAATATAPQVCPKPLVEKVSYNPNPTSEMQKFNLKPTSEFSKLGRTIVRNQEASLKNAEEIAIQAAILAHKTKSIQKTSGGVSKLATIYSAGGAAAGGVFKFIRDVTLRRTVLMAGQRMN